MTNEQAAEWLKAHNIPEHLAAKILKEVEMSNEIKSRLEEMAKECAAGKPYTYDDIQREVNANLLANGGAEQSGLLAFVHGLIQILFGLLPV